MLCLLRSPILLQHFHSAERIMHCIANVTLPVEVLRAGCTWLYTSPCNSCLFSTLKFPALQVKKHFLVYGRISDVGLQSEAKTILSSHLQFLVQRGSCSARWVLWSPRESASSDRLQLSKNPHSHSAPLMFSGSLERQKRQSSCDVHLQDGIGDEPLNGNS